MYVLWQADTGTISTANSVQIAGGGNNTFPQALFAMTQIPQYMPR